MGRVVQVTTLLSEMDAVQSGGVAAMSKAELEKSVAAQGAVVKAAKAAAKETGADVDLQAAQTEVATLLELKRQLEGVAEPITEADGAVDYGRDFFGRRAYLTVSGQLNGVAPQHAQHALHMICSVYAAVTAALLLAR